MAVSDDAILQLVGELGDLKGQLGRLCGTLDATVKNQDVLIKAQQEHANDPQAHSGVIPRVASLEKSRRWGRIRTTATTGGAVTAATVGVKVGWLSKLLTFLAAISTASPTP